MTATEIAVLRGQIEHAKFYGMLYITVPCDMVEQMLERMEIVPTETKKPSRFDGPLMKEE